MFFVFFFILFSYLIFIVIGIEFVIKEGKYCRYGEGNGREKYFYYWGEFEIKDLGFIFNS